MNTSDITKLATERRNPRSRDIDRLTTAEMVSLINSEDKKVADAVEKVCPQIAAAMRLRYLRAARHTRRLRVPANVFRLAGDRAGGHRRR